MNRRSRTVSLALSILLLGMAAGLSGCGQKVEAAKETAITVNSAKAQIMDISKTVDYSGAVRSSNEVQVLPKLEARVTAINVKPGDYVSQGQILLSLDNSDLEVSIKQAEAQLAQARAAQKSNELQLESARLNYERMQELFTAGAISEQQLEAARDQFQSLNAGIVQASVAQAEAALLSLQKQWENCNIISPIDGTVGSINVSLGDTSSPQMPVAVVTKAGDLEVEIMVSESDIPYIETNSKVDVLVEAVSDKAIKGTIKSVSTVADSRTRSYSVKIALANSEGRIKSGMFAELNLTTMTKKNVLAVPVHAVVPKGEKTIVYTIDEEQRAKKIEVHTGLENNNYIEISNGLKDGQTVVTDGNTLISNGTLLKIIGGGDGK